MVKDDTRKVAVILDTPENRERLAQFEQMAAQDEVKRKTCS